MIISKDLVYLFSEGNISVLFWTEVLIGIILPMILFSLPSVRRKPMQMFATSILVILGLLLNRFNISLFAFAAAPYAPTWLELLVSVGMVAIGVLVFTLASHYLPVFEPHEVKEPTEKLVETVPLKELEPAFVPQKHN